MTDCDGDRHDEGEGGGTLMIKLFAMAAEAGERNDEGGPQRSKTIMVRSDILHLPISDRPTAGQTRVCSEADDGGFPMPKTMAVVLFSLLTTCLCTNKLPAQRLSHTIPCTIHSLPRKQPEKNGEV